MPCPGFVDVGTHDLTICTCVSADEFVKEHKLASKHHGDGKEYNYLGMDGRMGGRFNIREGEVEQRFRELYAEDMSRPRPKRHMYVEMRTPDAFPMFYDLDEKSDPDTWQKVRGAHQLRLLMRSRRSIGSATRRCCRRMQSVSTPTP